MKHFITIILFCCAFAKAYKLTAQQYYKQHIVQQGETIYSVVKKYTIDEQQLKELNPDLKSGLKTGSVILIPLGDKELTQRNIVSYKDHKVRRKENLFRLSQQYGVTQLDIKEANRHLYSEPLKKGDRIRIPVFKTISDDDQGENTSNTPTNNLMKDGKYIVKTGDTKYNIATQYQIKVSDLEHLNPNLETLQPGMIINVPVNNVQDNNKQDEFVTYVVPSQMSMWRLEQSTGISEDSLLVLNPQLVDGLKAGMSLKIPKQSLEQPINPISKQETVNLVDYITSYQQQHIAVMLPLSLEQLTGDIDNYLLENKRSRIALDFYSGMLIARDSAQSLGIPVQYDLYDTQADPKQVSRIIETTDFDNYNAVIGPLLSKNVTAAAQQLQSKHIPVISPLSAQDKVLSNNMFISRPTDLTLKLKLHNYLKTYAADKNIILVTDAKKPELKNEYLAMFPNATALIPNKDNYIYKQSYIKALDPNKENWVILAVDNEGFITDAVSHYSAKAAAYNITMFGYDDYNQFELPNTRLASLRYTYPSINNDLGASSVFSSKYSKTYQLEPNAYATRGFDMAMDVILRNAALGDIYNSSDNHVQSQQVESRFNYTRLQPVGYINTSLYLLQYQSDLSVKELE